MSAAENMGCGTSKTPNGIALASGSSAQQLVSVAVVGRSGVGKTALIARYVEQRVVRDHNATTQPTVSTKHALSISHSPSLQIFDTPGLDTPLEWTVADCVASVDVVLLVLGPDDVLEELQTRVERGVPLVAVRMLRRDENAENADEYPVPVSAERDINVDRAFRLVVEATAPLFGTRLDALPRHFLEQDGVPHIVAECCRRIDVTQKGVFRECGSKKRIDQLRAQAEAGQLNLDNVDTHTVSGLLKLFLAELPEEMDEKTSNRVYSMLKRAADDPDNLMTAENIASCLAPTLVKVATEEDVKKAIQTVKTRIEDTADEAT